MNRRFFLKHAALATGGLSLAANLVQAKPRKSLTAAFQLSVVTEAPEAAIRELEHLLQTHLPASQRIAFAEHQLAGSHLSDLVWIENGTLIDYRNSRTVFGSHLQEFARDFGMPRSITHPIVLTFSSARAAGRPETVSVFRDNHLLTRLLLQNNRQTVLVDGERGGITVDIRDGAARIVAADCAHKTCMKLGSIRAQGQHLVCIPNRIRLAVDGFATGTVDATVY